MRPREKVTLRIPSDLIAEYQDWSWEARCQLSELVTRACRLPRISPSLTTYAAIVRITHQVGVKP
jgi:hypothetical protein